MPGQLDADRERVQDGSVSLDFSVSANYKLYRTVHECASETMMKVYQRVTVGSRTLVAATVLALLAVLGRPSTGAAQESVCDVRLTVEVSPSVPQATDDGFLSSLLSNHFAYRLELLRQDDSSVIEVDLSGPGPGYRCENVIQAMRRDARVESIQIDST